MVKQLVKMKIDNLIGRMLQLSITMVLKKEGEIREKSYQSLRSIIFFKIFEIQSGYLTKTLFENKVKYLF